MTNTVRLFGECAARSRKRGNRRSYHATRKDRAVSPAQPPNILIVYISQKYKISVWLVREI